MPMVDRDIYVASAQHPELKIETKNELKISIDEVRDTRSEEHTSELQSQD